MSRSGLLQTCVFMHVPQFILPITFPVMYVRPVPEKQTAAAPPPLPFALLAAGICRLEPAYPTLANWNAASESHA